MLLKKYSHKTLIRIAMSFLLVFFALGVVSRVAPPAAGFWEDALDALRGCTLGIAMAMVFLGLRTKSRL